MNDTCICENTPTVWRLTGVTRTLRLRIFNPDGTPLDLTGRTVAVTIARDNSEFSYAPGFVVEGDDNNVVKFEWPADKQGAGDYTINVTTTDGSGNVDRVNWHGPTGIRLVDFSFMVRGEDALGVTSEANIGLDGTFTMNGTGMSAYDEWLAEGHTGTPEDFIVWLRQPATDAASAAEAQMGQIQERADADHTRAGNDHTTAGQDHTRAGNDHTTATDDHRIAAADHSTATDDHTLAESDHGTAAEDHRVAGIDHGTAADDHTRAGNDHQTASDDHTQAGSDHTRAGEDHTRAGDDHQTASSDHTRAGEDHTTASNDHTRAGQDHTQAGNDHTRAEADHGIAADDHTQATADHAVMAGYDTRLTNVEGEVTQLGQQMNGYTVDVGTWSVGSVGNVSGGHIPDIASGRRIRTAENTIPISGMYKFTCDSSFRFFVSVVRLNITLLWLQTQELELVQGDIFRIVLREEPDPTNSSKYNGYTQEQIDALAESSGFTMKRIGSMKKEIEGLSKSAEDLYLDIHGELTIEKDYAWSPGYVASNGKITSSTASQYCQPILFRKGETLTYRSGTGFSNAVVQVANSNPCVVNDTGFIVQTLVSSSNNTEVSYTFASDMWVVITVTAANYDLTVKMLESESIDEQISGMESDISTLQSDVEALESGAFKDRAVLVDSIPNTSFYINNKGVWKESSMNYASRYTNVIAGEVLKIKALSDRSVVFALVSSFGEVDSTPNYAQFNERQVVSQGEERTVIVEVDCILWVYAYLDANTCVFPEKLVVRELVFENTNKITRYGINLFDDSEFESGTLDTSGNVASGSDIVTDFVKIGVDNDWKTQYLHICSTNPSTHTFAFDAKRVCTYTAKKVFIGYIDTVSAAIDKESVGNAPIFADAHYVRVQFASNRENLYIANNNFTKLPDYSKFDIASLTTITSFVADGIHNSDGAVTNMIDTALDYINNLSTLDLGYGDSNTAFDQTVEAVTADPWNPGRYEGEKKQINCSGFVQLCLQGIRYRNSRYVSGSSGMNIGINGYKFDSKSEQNYHNNFDASGGRNILCSNYNKFYAHRLAKYASDRGFLYIPKPDYSNIEVGDVLFSGSSTGNFKKIGHCAFVSRIVLKKDGTRTIYYMEVSGTTAHEAYTDRNWTCAARFPLPVVSMQLKNLVSSVTNSSPVSNLTANTSQTLAVLTLSENVKEHGIYTITIEVDNVPDGSEVIAYAGGTALGITGSDVFVRGDKKFVYYSFIQLGDGVNTNTLTVKVKANSTFTGTVNYVNAVIYKGYVTM